MRPVRLDMDGFAAFREPTTVDFTDADYFVLVGATGSGKSTVIDAMIFALYGSVPRWSDRRAVMYGLAPTAVRGTVRLLFEVGDQRYVVARELRRTKTGVSVKNARLDRLRDAHGAVDSDAVSVASDSGTSGAVERLLGLSFEHFCQCVVLPQGAFSEFLRAKGSDRRAILLQLLGATLYGDMQRAANQRAMLAANQVTSLDDRLVALGDATDAAVAAAQARVDALRMFDGVVRQSVDHIGALAVRRAEAAATRDRLAAEHAALTAVALPADLDDLENTSAATRAALTAAREAAEAAEAVDTAARADVAAAPARGPVESALRHHRELSDLAGRLPALVAASVEAADVLTGARQARSAAVTAAQVARGERDRAAATADAARRAVQTIEREIGLLAAVEMPPGAAEIDAVVRAAGAALGAATERREAAERADADARAALLATPARQRLHVALTTLTDLETAQQEQALLSDQLENALARDSLDRAAADEAERAYAAAVADRDRALGADRADALRPLLVVGQACPVCRQPVGHLPDHVPPAGLAAAEAAVDQARSTLTAAQAGATAAGAGAAAARARVEGADTRIATLRTQLAGRADTADEIRRQLATVDASEVAASAAAAAAADARRDEQQAVAEQQAALASGAELARALRIARDPLVAIGAPAVDGSAYAGWARLAEWATDQVAALAQSLSVAREADVVAAEGLGAATGALRAAEEAETAAHATEISATAAAEQAAAAVGAAEHRQAVVVAELTGAPDFATATVTLARLDELTAAAQNADSALLKARRAHQEADTAVARVARRYDAAWQLVRSARDPLVSLGAPELAVGTVSAAWASLTGWATDTAGSTATARDTAGAQVDRLIAARAGALQELEARFIALDVPFGADDSAVAAVPAVAAAVARAQAAHAQLVVRRAEAVTLVGRRERAVEDQRVAAELSRLLRSNNFPEWLEATALDALVVDASEKLEQLSNRQFALTHRDGEFFVVDHADADSLRSVRTLSGGETFQASLALALALSAQLSDMAAAGAARLDSIFLDEGFGTLDANSLDVVAETLETLARGDRMVGIITHVPALADRVPVRFLVRRDDRSSRVEREDL